MWHGDLIFVKQIVMAHDLAVCDAQVHPGRHSRPTCFSPFQPYMGIAHHSSDQIYSTPTPVHPLKTRSNPSSVPRPQEKRACKRGVVHDGRRAGIVGRRVGL